MIELELVSVHPKGISFCENPQLMAEERYMFVVTVIVKFIISYSLHKVFQLALNI